MSRRRAALVAAGALIAVTTAALWFGSEHSGAQASAISRGPSGLLLARRYLEARDVVVQLRDRPFDDDLRADGELDALVFALPLQRWPDRVELQVLDRYVRAGGNLVLAYSTGDGIYDRMVGRALDLDLVTVRADPPLLPWSWWSFSKEEWTLLAEPSELPGARPIVVAAPRAIPEAPRHARVLYRNSADGTPVVFEVVRGRGRILAVPADVWSNARLLREPGNVDLLEAIRASLGSRWQIDEYHHGLTSGDIVRSRAGVAWDQMLAHLAVLYIAGLFALARPFGPVWQQPTPNAGSTATFLRQLGNVHQRAGHEDAAKRLLVERALLYDASLALPPELRGAPTSDPDATGEAAAVDRASLLDLARTVARAQSRRRDRWT